MQRDERGMWNVSQEDGRYLAALVGQLGAKQVLEIGTSNGYSSIWLAQALAQTGGRLITLEIDKHRHELALENFRKAGLEHLIDARLGDARTMIPEIEGRWDLVFIDGWHADYSTYLELILPNVRAGGLVVAHNVKSHAHLMREFLAAIEKDPTLVTHFLVDGRSGLSVSQKKGSLP